MRRYLVCALSALVLLSLTAMVCAQGEIWVDRVEESGRVLVPLRGIFESFGAAVNWNGGLRQIEIIAGGNQIVMYVNDHNAYINGNRYYMDVPPRIVRSQTHVPLRFVGEALGGTVDYLGSYVDITGPTGYLLRVHLQRRGGGGQPPAGGYLASWTSTRRVTAGDLRGYSNWQLTLIRNEIYARKGRPFDNPQIRAYFLSQSWYSPNRNFSESWLTRLESENAAYIRDYQTQVYGSAATRP